MMWLRTGSKTVLAFVAESRRRKRIIAIAAVLIVIAVVIGALLFNKFATARAEEARADNWSSLSKCMLGAPLKDSESAAARFRKIQIGALSQVDAKRAASKDDAWPDRCQTFAYKLNEATQGKDDFAAVATAAEALAKALDGNEAFSADLSEQVDAMWKAAKEAAIPRFDKSDVDPAPAPNDVLDVEAIAKYKAISLKTIELANVFASAHGDSAVRLVIEDGNAEGSPLACKFTALGGDCAPLPPGVSKAGAGGYRIVGTADDSAAPLVVAGKDGSAGIFRSDDGTELGQAKAIGGWAAADGLAAALTIDGDRLEVLRLKDGKNANGGVTTRLRFDDAGRDAQMLWQWVAVVGNSGDEVWLATGEVGDRGTVRLENVGQLSKPSGPLDSSGRPRVSGCRSGQAVVVRVANGPDEYLSFNTAGRWTKPVQLAKAGGTLSCHKSEAAIVRVDKGETLMASAITHNRCTPAQCQTKTLTVREMLSGETMLGPSVLFDAIDVDGKLLAAWAAGARGGVRVRLGAPGQIAKANDIIVFDDLKKGNAVQSQSSLVDMRLFGADTFAVLILNTTAGVYALRITADGTVSPAM